MYRFVTSSGKVYEVTVIAWRESLGPLPFRAVCRLPGFRCPVIIDASRLQKVHRTGLEPGR